MDKKLYSFSIEYKLVGYEKHIFNKYKKIEIIDYEDGYMLSDTVENLKQNLFKLYKQRVLKEIKETGDYTTIDYSTICLNRVYISDISNISINKFICNEATMEKAIKYLSVTEFLEAYGNDIYKKIEKGELK